VAFTAALDAMRCPKGLVLLLLGTVFLTSSITTSSTIPMYRAGGRVSAWRLMGFSVGSWLCT
jgi:hypothetical protein